MKKLFFVGFFVVASALTATAANQKLRVPRLKTIGIMKYPVLAQTTPELVEKKSGFTVLRKYYIARWGLHRFEYGLVQYQCRSSRCETLGEPVALKFYKECTGFKKNGQPNCRGLESARVDVTDPYAETDNTNRDRRTWYTCEDYGSPCADRDEWNEYPSRHTPENPEFPLDF